MIDARLNSDTGEFDMLFKDKKMYIQYKDHKSTLKEIGNVNITGKSAEGVIPFQVTDWKSDPKIWPHDKMYGVFLASTGYWNIFRFAEVAISDKPITKLQDGL